MSYKKIDALKNLTYPEHLGKSKLFSLERRKGLHTGTGQVTVQRSSRQKESQKIESKIFYYIRPVPLSDLSRYGTGIDSRVLFRVSSSMRSAEMLYDINKSNAIKQIYLDNYCVIMFFQIKYCFPL